MSNLANWFVYDGSLVCVPAKNGGTSFYRAAFKIGDNVTDNNVYSHLCMKTKDEGHGPFTPEHASRLVRSYAPEGAFLAVRDPCERFLSLWRDKCLRQDPNLWWMRGWSMKKLMDAIEKGPFINAHWFPQSAYLIPEAEPVDYRNLQQLFDLPNQPCNVSAKGVESCDIVRERIYKHYAKDFELWQAANSA